MTVEIEQTEGSSDEFEIVSNNEEIQREVSEENQVEEQATEITREEPSEEPQVNPTSEEEEREGRKVYITKAAEKYHLSQGCKSSYERKACNNCQERTTQTLTFNEGAPRTQSRTLIGFIKHEELYHDESCIRYRNQRRNMEQRPVCKVCEDEERTTLWARNRQPTGRESKRG